MPCMKFLKIYGNVLITLRESIQPFVCVVDCFAANLQVLIHCVLHCHIIYIGECGLQFSYRIDEYIPNIENYFIFYSCGTTF